MPKQLIYRLRCPGCDEWAQLRLANASTRHGRVDLRVVMFDCPNAGNVDHPVSSDDQLLNLPGELIESVDYDAGDESGL